MNKSTGSSLVAVLLSTVLLSACSGTSTSVSKVYEKSDFDSGGFRHFLVIGVSEDRSTRRQFENAMVRALADRDIDAVASATVMAWDISLNRDTVIAAAGETGSDAVLVSRLKSSEASVEMVEGRTEIDVKRKDERLVDFFRYDYEAVPDPGSMEVTRTVVVASDVYSVASGDKVWGVESTTFDKKGLSELIDSKSSAIVRQLKGDGLAY